MTDTSVPILEMRHVSKCFGRIEALKNVELKLFAGEIHALMGENGAGKSTLMKILSGAYMPDPGAEFLIDGYPITLSDPQGARKLGISIIYQELSLAPNLTVAENIALGREPRHGLLADRRSMRDACADMLRRLGVDFEPDTLVATLSIAEMQMVEIARALSAKARILIMDEPTTALSSRETERLFTLVEQLRKEGLAVVYISHRMAEVYQLADRCSVLRDGSYIGTLPRAELSAETLVRMMVGRDVSELFKTARADAANASAKPVLTIENLTDGDKVAPASFVLRSGEVVGLAGLVGSGRTELARLIFGADRTSSGSISINGVQHIIRSPADAMKAGIAYLTEDRKEQGLFLDMTIDDNINIAVAARDARPFGLRRFATARRRTDAAMEALAVRASSGQATVGALSGGNQQKVLLARLLETAPKVLILDEPTRGVDIGAKAEIYKLIDRLAMSGVAILLISSELPEIVGLSDRVLVIREGSIVAEIGERSQISPQAIISIAMGEADAPKPAA